MLSVVAALFTVIPAAGPATAAGDVGAGFTVTAGDLQYILQQIKVAEAHANTLTSDNLCGTLVGPGPNQIPDRLTSYGLRTVDGSCNNLFDQQTKFGAADQVFPRLTNPVFRDAEASAPGFPPQASSSYKQKLARQHRSTTRSPGPSAT